MSEMTPWFGMGQNPVRPGEYEGREKRTRCRIVVHWRKLEDTDHYDWFFYRGVLGPFNMWESARDKMTAWRGFAQPPAMTGSGKPETPISLKRCAAGQDGECCHALCPQIRDGEPKRSGRHCPLDVAVDD
ncbi:MAG: hypothetical protein JSV72_07345 [Ralstonia sp.]|jgi:hypothetical protein|nr:MAG: hypothetical protein JSV72_07345 [Ralstonia sp.]